MNKFKILTSVLTLACISIAFMTAIAEPLTDAGSVSSKGRNDEPKSSQAQRHNAVALETKTSGSDLGKILNIMMSPLGNQAGFSASLVSADRKHSLEVTSSGKTKILKLVSLQDNTAITSWTITEKTTDTEIMEMSTKVSAAFGIQASEIRAINPHATAAKTR